MHKQRIEPINGAYYTKDGTLKNLDGHTGGGSSFEGTQRIPFNGTFIGHDGELHDISEILEGLGGGTPASFDHILPGVGITLEKVANTLIIHNSATGTTLNFMNTDQNNNLL